MAWVRGSTKIVLEFDHEEVIRVKPSNYTIVLGGFINGQNVEIELGFSEDKEIRQEQIEQLKKALEELENAY